MSMDMTRTVVGVDTAKSVFALYWIDHETGEIVNRTLRRGKFLAHFEGLSPCLVGMEACGGSRHRARLPAGRPRNVVAVAPANRMARMIRALPAHGRTYRADHVSRPPTRMHPA